jgi:uncharacterized protein YeaO (DUF488 family)
MTIRTKRIYEEPRPEDGTRILVDRLWPRGVSKEEATLDEWLKEIAPSDNLREWFDHDSGRWEEFVSRYHDELADREAEIERLRSLAQEETVTLLYAATDTQHNNAVALKRHLENGDC